MNYQKDGKKSGSVSIKADSDFIIDWGDSRVFFRTNGSDKSILSHTYKKPDVYTIKLYGTINWFNYDQIPDDWKTLPEGDISPSDEYGFGF